MLINQTTLIDHSEEINNVSTTLSPTVTLTFFGGEQHLGVPPAANEVNEYRYNTLQKEVARMGNFAESSSTLEDRYYTLYLQVARMGNFAATLEDTSIPIYLPEMSISNIVNSTRQISRAEAFAPLSHTPINFSLRSNTNTTTYYSIPSLASYILQDDMIDMIDMDSTSFPPYSGFNSTDLYKYIKAKDNFKLHHNQLVATLASSSTNINNPEYYQRVITLGITNPLIIFPGKTLNIIFSYIINNLQLSVTTSNPSGTLTDAEQKTWKRFLKDITNTKETYYLQDYKECPNIQALLREPNFMLALADFQQLPAKSREDFIKYVFKLGNSTNFLAAKPFTAAFLIRKMQENVEIMRPFLDEILINLRSFDGGKLLNTNSLLNKLVPLASYAHSIMPNNYRNVTLEKITKLTIVSERSLPFIIKKNETLFREYARRRDFRILKETAAPVKPLTAVPSSIVNILPGLRVAKPPNLQSRQWKPGGGLFKTINNNNQLFTASSPQTKLSTNLLVISENKDFVENTTLVLNAQYDNIGSMSELKLSTKSYTPNSSSSNKSQYNKWRGKGEELRKHLLENFDDKGGNLSDHSLDEYLRKHLLSRTRVLSPNSTKAFPFTSTFSPIITTPTSPLNSNNNAVLANIGLFLLLGVGIVALYRFYQSINKCFNNSYKDKNKFKSLIPQSSTEDSIPLSNLGSSKVTHLYVNNLSANKYMYY